MVVPNDVQILNEVPMHQFPGAYINFIILFDQVLRSGKSLQKYLV